MAKEKETSAQESINSKPSGFVVGDYYTVTTSLFDLRGEVTELHEQEVVIRPFRFDSHSMIRFHNGLSEPFLSEMILGRNQIVVAKRWSPS